MLNRNSYEQSDLYRMRHSAAHVLAQAVRELFPGVKLGIGPPTEHGFYYDFDLGVDDGGKVVSFRPGDLKRIEKRMRQIMAGKHELIYREIDVEEARDLFADEPYKLELVEQFAAENSALSTYRQDGFEDLCRGPHVADTGMIPAGAFKLMSIAGAYWRGDESQPMLQRIYGTAWPSRKELKAHLHMLEEAKKRDHRKLGRELEIFILDDEVGPGLPLWLPRGEIIVDELEKLAREMEDAAGYQRVRTPHIAKDSLFLRSRHLPYYEDEMYPPMERAGSRYFLRPMNCPFHHKIFGSKPRSYRDMPLRLAEYGNVYRYEQSGTLMGLLRVRGQQQNDAHIYCSYDQFEQEFMGVMDLYRVYFDLFGFERYVMRLSKHSPAKLGKKYVNQPEMWLKVEGMIRDVMVSAGIPFVEEEDEAAFYGPKIDVQIWSAIGREFSLATNQADFAVPPRFDLSFTNERGEAETPLCIHRAPLGSHERFVGFLIEHYAGNFPVWLSPEQVRVVPITDRHNEYAQQIESRLREAGIRAACDVHPGRMQAKIRSAQKMKVPYMLVVGDNEMANGTVALRKRNGEREEGISVGVFVERVKEVVSGRVAHL